MIPEGEYLKTLLMINEAQTFFENNFSKALNLLKVPCPLFIPFGTGLQDDLTGIEKSVTFEKDKEIFEVVHSLAKWKREALARYGFQKHMGIFTNMKAIRKDEVVDPLHSFLVDQWDWEKVISKEDRNLGYLKFTVSSIYEIILKTLSYLEEKFSLKKLSLPSSVTFVSSEDLYDNYQNLSSQEREQAFVRDEKAVFIIGVGKNLKDGKPHDLRSPDYDDWDLNGDLLLYSDVLKSAVEISSMGIRVDKKSMEKQLKISNCEYKLSFPYHKKILNEELPYTIGGGIGKSRLLMFLLRKSHIAQVQASFWGKNVENFLYSNHLKSL